MSDEPTIHLPLPVIDTHFHGLHMAERNLDTFDILEKALSGNLVAALDVAVDEYRFDERLELAGRLDRLFLSAGIHPSSVDSNLGERLDMIKNQLGRSEVLAVGETGLDSYRDYSPASLQEESFRAHLDLAVEFDKPVIIHNREADKRVLAILKESRCRRGVFHCFSSNMKTAIEALDLGFHISFAGNLTFKKNQGLRDLAAGLPSDRLLVETDAPYLSPVPRRGRPNHPGHVGYTLEVLAGTRGEDPTEFAGKLVDNSRRLFGFPV